MVRKEVPEKAPSKRIDSTTQKKASIARSLITYLRVIEMGREQ
jgi:hypothetical protein